MRKLRFGVIGCAEILNRHMGPALMAAGGSELIAVASRDPAKSAAFAGKHGCATESDYESLLQRTDIDAVYIPLPIGLHEEWCVRAAKAGKHILCEKSLAPDCNSAGRIIDAARSAGVLITENFMCGFHSQHAEVLRILTEGSLGEVRVFSSRFGFPPLPEGDIRYQKSLGGGALNDNGAYLVFMARRLFGAEPVRAFSVPRMGPTGVDVSGSVMLEFPGDRIAHLDFGFSFDYQNNYELWGEKGTLRVGRAYSIPPTMVPEISLVRNNQIQAVTADACNHFIGLIEDFCAAVRAPERYEGYYRNLELQAEALGLIRGF